MKMEVSCSKGTYIRTLCNDIGEKLGCFGCMESLLRTKVSQFEIQESLKLSEIQEKKDQGKFSEILMPLDTVFFKYPAVTVKEEGQSFAYNGNEIPVRFLKYVPDEKKQEKNTCIRFKTSFYRVFSCG